MTLRWSDVPTVIGGDFNVIPEDIDCHKPASWIHDALFQPEPRARYRDCYGTEFQMMLVRMWAVPQV